MRGVARKYEPHLMETEGELMELTLSKRVSTFNPFDEEKVDRYQEYKANVRMAQVLVRDNEKFRNLRNTSNE